MFDLSLPLNGMGRVAEANLVQLDASFYVSSGYISKGRRIEEEYLIASYRSAVAFLVVCSRSRLVRYDESIHPERVEDVGKVGCVSSCEMREKRAFAQNYRYPSSTITVTDHNSHIMTHMLCFC